MNLVLFRQSPYGTSYTGEGVRAVLSLGAFEVDVAVLFLDDGVFALLKHQNPEELLMKPVGKGIESLFDFGVEKVLVCKESLETRGLDRTDLLDVDMQVINNEKIHKIMDQSNVILTF